MTLRGDDIVNEFKVILDDYVQKRYGNVQSETLVEA
jgi:(E)-4-hydroxy-3-methylbut-2-enyl-diphosphate synthase